MGATQAFKIGLVMGLLVAGPCGPQAATAKTPRLGRYRACTRFNEINRRLLPGSIHGVLQQTSGQYWIADAFDLYSYDDGTRRLTPILNAPPCPRPICEVPDGTTWFAVGFLPGRLDEIARFDGNRWDVFTANALMQLAGVASTGAEPRIHLAFPGVAGKVWFAIDDSFISYNGRDWSAYPGLLRVIDSRPKGGVVPISAALENEDGRVWSAVSHLGIFTLDERTRDFTPTQGVAEELRGLPQGLTDGRADITSIYEDTSGRTWFPDASGWLYIRSNRDQSWSSVSLLNALDVTHRYGVQPVYLTLASGSPRALDDGEGMLTFATERGVAAFFKRTGRWALIDSTGGLLPADRVLCITRDHSGRIWIGTDSGLAVFER